MQGFQAPYVPGWDNHGMPIENAVAKKFREDKQIVDRVTLRRACREYAAKWVEVQRGQFKRLGIRGDWHDPYLTMSRDFEAKIVEVFGELAEQGFIYRGLKPVFWCGTCETALADAEVEYEPHVSNSIYVRFPAAFHDPNGVFDLPVPRKWNGKRENGVPRSSGQQRPGRFRQTWRLRRTRKRNTPSFGRSAANFASGYYLVAVPLVESVMNAAGRDGIRDGDKRFAAKNWRG